MQSQRNSFRLRKSIRLMAALALLYTGCNINDVIDHNGEATVTEEFAFEIEVLQQSRFRLEGVNGNIDIVGVPNAQTAQIWGERKVTSSDAADARAYLSQLEVRVTDGAEELFIKTVQPRENRGRNFEVTYHVRIPCCWHVTLSNANGNVAIDSVRQGLSVAIANGNVLVGEVAGTVGVTAVNGNISFEAVQGNTLAAVTNGNITGDLFLPAAGTCDLSTVNGAIDLGVPKTTSADLSAELTNGSITVLGLSVRNATTSSRSVRGRLGEGDGKIALRTVNGNIRVAGF